jgi:hypothetical protein
LDDPNIGPSPDRPSGTARAGVLAPAGARADRQQTHQVNQRK